MNVQEMETHLRSMPVGSWIYTGFALVHRQSDCFWAVIPLAPYKQGFGVIQSLEKLATAELAGIRGKVKNPTTSTLNPNSWGGAVEKPNFQIKKIEGPAVVEISGKPITGFRIPKYLQPIYDLIDDNHHLEARNSLNVLLHLLHQYQQVTERMPDWVFTADTPTADAVATGNSSVWPIDADRKYANNPIEANENRRRLADFICDRLGYGGARLMSDPQSAVNVMIRQMAYKGASEVGVGPPEADMHGRTCGEAVVRGIIEGLLKLLSEKAGGSGIVRIAHHYLGMKDSND